MKKERACLKLDTCAARWASALGPAGDRSMTSGSIRRCKPRSLLNPDLSNWPVSTLRA
jgi:hypothetical protein